MAQSHQDQPPFATRADDLGRAIEHEGELIDSAGTLVLPVLAMFGTSAISPTLAAADGWVGIFVGTLAWSLGWAFLRFFVFGRKVQRGYRVVLGAGACFLGSLWIATVVGWASFQGLARTLLK